MANIDFHAVNMRSKKKRDDIPRPMSWEGELSDGEKDGMCVDEENSAQVKYFYNLNWIIRLDSIKPNSFYTKTIKFKR